MFKNIWNEQNIVFGWELFKKKLAELLETLKILELTKAETCRRSRSQCCQDEGSCFADPMQRNGNQCFICLPGKTKNTSIF